MVLAVLAVGALAPVLESRHLPLGAELLAFGPPAISVGLLLGRMAAAPHRNATHQRIGLDADDGSARNGGDVGQLAVLAAHQGDACEVDGDSLWDDDVDSAHDRD